MKIKSITDVITNSSTEVWAIRSNILKEARSLFRDESWREKNCDKKDWWYEF